jgi:hypothetical protein
VAASKYHIVDVSNEQRKLELAHVVDGINGIVFEQHHHDDEHDRFDSASVRP